MDKDFRHSSGNLEDAYFYGREDEISELQNNIDLRQHTALIAQRQLGKTALIHKAIDRHPDKPLKAHIDLTRKSSLQESARVLVDSFMQDNFGIKRFLVLLKTDFTSITKKAFMIIGSVKKVKLSEFEYELKEIEILASETKEVKSIELFVKAIEFIDNVASSTEKRAVIFIDEVQRLPQFPEAKKHDVLWPMRSAIQDTKSSVLIIAGSKPTAVKEMISNPDAAFFQSFISMDIKGIIDEDFYEHFKSVCEKYKVDDIQELTKFTYEICSGIPSYLSLFGRKLFDQAKKSKSLSTDMYFKAIEDMYRELSNSLRLIEEKISEIPNGVLVYKAIFVGDNPKIEAERLSGTSSANIQNTTLKKLQDSGFIYKDGWGSYKVLDTVLGYYMAEFTEAEHFRDIYKEKVIRLMM